MSTATVQVTASHQLSSVNRVGAGYNLGRNIPDDGATLGAGLAASQSKLVFVGELRPGVFPNQGYNFSGAKGCGSRENQM